jgi:hypothetical protein
MGSGFRVFVNSDLRFQISNRKHKAKPGQSTPGPRSVTLVPGRDHSPPVFPARWRLLRDLKFQILKFQITWLAAFLFRHGWRPPWPLPMPQEAGNLKLSFLAQHIRQLGCALRPSRVGAASGRRRDRAGKALEIVAWNLGLFRSVVRSARCFRRARRLPLQRTLPHRGVEEGLASRTRG